MKSINEINIKNVKGIEKLNIKNSIIPNKPTFFVAPNGFGKSSFALAFNSLNRDRLKLSESDYYLNDETKLPSIELNYTDDNNTKINLIANKDTNEISKIFEISVIKNLLKPSENSKSLFSKSSSLEVENITIIEKIPSKFELPYQVTKYRTLISDNRRIWIDISYLLTNKYLINDLANLDVLKKFELKTQVKIINEYKDIVKGIEGNGDDIIKVLNDGDLTILTNKFFIQIYTLLKHYVDKSDAEIILIAIQIIELYKNDNDSFFRLFNYKYYCIQKKRVLELFKSFETTWKGIVPKEINITKKIKGKRVLIHKNFGIEFPKASDISNGERDVISFIGSLLKAEINFNGKPTILIIDEVFDYLDDANLLAVQYYITKFIKFFKDRKVPFFPLILTHLNPYYFKNYFFSKQKVLYLSKWKGAINRDIENIIISRNNSINSTYKDKISSFFLHFNPSELDATIDIGAEFLTQNLGNVNQDLCKTENFKIKISEYLDNYIKNRRNYDPISVCIATRVLIEQKIYNKLPDELKPEFIETHKTVNKLNFANENSEIIIPEIYYLLGTIYNELLHVRKNNDNASPIYLKLDNKTIRKMITQITE